MNKDKDYIRLKRNQMKVIRGFLRLLADNGALHAYAANIGYSRYGRARGEYTSRLFHKEFMNLCKVFIDNYGEINGYGFIKSAFVWDNTPEKYSFWKGIDIKWNNKLDKINYG